MKYKTTYLVFILFLCLLIFSGCTKEHISVSQNQNFKPVNIIAYKVINSKNKIYLVSFKNNTQIAYNIENSEISTDSNVIKLPFKNNPYIIYPKHVFTTIVKLSNKTFNLKNMKFYIEKSKQSNIPKYLKIKPINMNAGICPSNINKINIKLNIYTYPLNAKILWKIKNKNITIKNNILSINNNKSQNNISFKNIKIIGYLASTLQSKNIVKTTIFINVTLHMNPSNIGAPSLSNLLISVSSNAIPNIGPIVPNNTSSVTTPKEKNTNNSATIITIYNNKVVKTVNISKNINKTIVSYYPTTLNIEQNNIKQISKNNIHYISKSKTSNIKQSHENNNFKNTNFKNSKIYSHNSVSEGSNIRQFHENNNLSNIDFNNSKIYLHNSATIAFNIKQSHVAKNLKNIKFHNLKFYTYSYVC